MIRRFASCLSCLFVLLAYGCESMNGAAAGPGAGGAGASADGEQQHHVYTPADLKWQPAPPALLPGAEMVVLEGDPSKPGFFAMRLRFPDGYKVMPHWHPQQERVTILSGTLNLGHGDTFNPAAVRPLTAGSYSTMRPGMRHFAFATGVTELQLATIGPWAVNYVNPDDDPRKGGKSATASRR